jgi:hypothetical protein
VIAQEMLDKVSTRKTSWWWRWCNRRSLISGPVARGDTGVFEVKYSFRSLVSFRAHGGDPSSATELFLSTCSHFPFISGLPNNLQLVLNAFTFLILRTKKKQNCPAEC